ncbi:hypothetical protein [Gilliamella sp. Pas-s25]|uniref:hypothetical protein n=1 Tax=Gilliamella sp. Pas-s25 TaxID=2687310 RepID=UPI00135D11E6|nr:hypothetical protein [Gilliamella sp. Pas-s25]MWP63291.1 hypothetical protein [Gilliamella sp. Pas-s25]
MNNSRLLIDLYLQNQRSEHEILANLEFIIGLKIESVNFPCNESLLFVLLMEYSQGFKQGLSIMWSDDLNITLDGKSIAQKLACALNVSILFDSSLFEDSSANNNDKWFLVKSNGMLRQVDIAILDDGIDILP